MSSVEDLKEATENENTESKGMGISGIRFNFYINILKLWTYLHITFWILDFDPGKYVTYLNDDFKALGILGANLKPWMVMPQKNVFMKDIKKFVFELILLGVRLVILIRYFSFRYSFIWL